MRYRWILVGVLALANALAWSGTAPAQRLPPPSAASHVVMLDGPGHGWFSVRIEWRLAAPLQQLAASLFGWN